MKGKLYKKSDSKVDQFVTKILDMSFLNRMFVLLPVFVFFFASQTFSDPNSGIAFIKKEIAFFKWGEDKNEIRLMEGRIHHHGGNFSKTEKGNGEFRWRGDLTIDGMDDVFIQDGKGHTLIISPDGGSIKTVDADGIIPVDEKGNMYGIYSKPGEQSGLIVTKLDGTQEVYKNFDFKYEENGIAYDLKNDKAITIFDSDDKPEKLPPKLFSRLFPQKALVDFKKDANNLFRIKTKKINKHLKKIDRRVDKDEIKIQIENKGNFKPQASLLGVDDSGNFYFLCGFPVGPIDLGWSEASVRIYSEDGRKLTEVPLDLNYFNKDVSGMALDIHGNFFQSLASKDGVHILKWVKN